MSPADPYMDDLLVEAHDALSDAIDALQEASPTSPFADSLAEELETLISQLEWNEVLGGQ
jgi:hypothetical protein